MFGIAAIVVMLCSFDMEYDELLANLRRAGMWLPAVVGLWIIIYLFNTLSWYIIIRDGKKGTPIPFWKVYKLTVSGFALNYATPVGLMGGEPYRIMELTPYVGASKATSSVILYVMMHIFSHFCFWLFILLWIYVNVYVGKCIHTCPTGIFMPFETPLFIEPALSISPLFSERVVLCALRPQKHGLQ